MAVKVTGVQKGTPAQKLGLSGCTLLSIDGNEINDMLDYEFYSQGPVLELAVVRGARLEYVRAEKEEYAPLGCEFESYLIDKKHSCKNKCMFCFIDQMPKGMRKTLYFKDDDERLSFLFGNYITLTNLNEHEVQRIIRMHISPINISVHTMDPRENDEKQARGRGAGLSAAFCRGGHRDELPACAVPRHQRRRRAALHPARAGRALPGGEKHCRRAKRPDEIPRGALPAAAVRQADGLRGAGYSGGIRAELAQGARRAPYLPRRRMVFACRAAHPA